MISESIALNRIFEDPTLKKALEEFFEAQTTIETVAAAELMALETPDVDGARKRACYAKAYEEAMNRLRAYARKV